MQITHLNVNDFGVWSDLDLTGVSGGLNVLYGPRGAGKMNLVEFVRSMLFGFQAHVYPEQVHHHANRSGGSLTVEGRFGRQTIRRFYDGTLRGNLTIENEHGSYVQEHRLHDLLSGIEEAIFDRVFAFSFRDRQEIDRLVDGAIATGFGLAGDDQTYGRRRDLHDLLGEYQERLNLLPEIHLSVRRLKQRRCDLEAEIQRLSAPVPDYKVNWSEERADWIEDTTLCEEELDDLYDELHQINMAISSYQDARGPSVDKQKPRYGLPVLRESWRAMIEAFDSELDRWRCLLRDMQSQRQKVQNELFDFEYHEINLPTERGADPRQGLRRIETQILDLQRVAEQAIPSVRSNDPDHDFATRTSDTTVQSIHDDVRRLCVEIIGRDRVKREATTAAELAGLRRCEILLRKAIRQLMKRRQECLARLSADHNLDSSTLFRYYADYQCDTCHDRACGAAQDTRTPGSNSDNSRPYDDAAVERLRRRRDNIQWDIDAVKVELRGVKEHPRRPLRFSNYQVDHDLERYRRELADIERQLQAAADRVELLDKIDTVRAQIQANERYDRKNVTLRDAAEFLRRMTRDELCDLHLTAHRTLVVEDRAAERVEYHRLGTGARDQVYLSLCLALVAAYARQNVQLPLIINDICLNLDTDWAEATADVLQDFAGRGHQIVLLTGEDRIAQLFRWRNVWVCDLPRPEEPQLVISASEQDTYREHDLERRESLGNIVGSRISSDRQRQAVGPIQANRHAYDVRSVEVRDVVAKPAAADFDPSTAHSTRTYARYAASPYTMNSQVRMQATENNHGHGTKYYVTEDSPIEDAPSIDANVGVLMRSVGVHRIADLLRIVPSDISERLRHSDITTEIIKCWQSEALLVCRVANLRPYDARILVACGISEPETLAQIHPDELLDRVEAFAETRVGRELIHSGTDYELARLSDWLRTSRFGRRRFERTEKNLQPRAFRPRNYDPSDEHDREKAERVPRTKRRVRTRSSTTDGSRSRSDRRSRSSTASRRSSRSTTRRTTTTSTTEHQSGLRHYLELNSPVVDAPSIGPRTAERLQAAGIMVVADLLKADAAVVAERVAHRRIKAETIREWQAQTTLAVRIPQLRGHDAQILVACGVTTPEELRQSEASDLWSKVAPFIETNEGKRIIRNGKAPDLAEVQDWISWAEHSRSLQAA